MLVFLQTEIKKGFQFLETLINSSDLDRIQTCNLLSRNQVRYSVAPRGLFCGCKYMRYINTYQIIRRSFFIFFVPIKSLKNKGYCSVGKDGV